MKCPYCPSQESKVIDSREVNEGIRRRRQCLSCGERFTTYERPLTKSLFIIKKDGRREAFHREKLATGMSKACEKRPLPPGSIDRLVEDIETELFRLGKAEVPSRLIGDMVMERLKKLDHIAYIRFASVYREFTDLASLKQAVDSLAVGKEVKAVPASQLPLLPEEKIKVFSRSNHPRGKSPSGSRKPEREKHASAKLQREKRGHI